jgi:ABC-type amino acid transport substrate-binding protein
MLRHLAIGATLACTLLACSTAPPPAQSNAAPAGSSDQPVPAESDAADPELIQRALQPWTGDLDQMIERRIIRALVPYSKTFYVLDGAKQRGLAVDVMRQFEQAVNERLGDKTRLVTVMLIPVRRDNLLSYLREGRGDLALGNITVTPERQKVVDFSSPLKTDAIEIVVTGAGVPPLASRDELAGRQVYVRESSSYYQHL